MPFEWMHDRIHITSMKIFSDELKLVCLRLNAFKSCVTDGPTNCVTITLYPFSVPAHIKYGTPSTPYNYLMIFAS